MTVAAALEISLGQVVSKEAGSNLVVWENQGVCKYNVFSASCCKNNDLRNVLWSERLTSTTIVGLAYTRAYIEVILRIYSIGFGLVSIKPDNGEFLARSAQHHNFTETTYSLNLSRIYLNNSYTSGHQLPSHGIREASNGSLRCTVDGSSLVWFTSGNTANVDNIPCTSVCPLLENGKNSLRHINKSGNIRIEHRLDILLRDLSSFGNTLHKSPRLLSFSSFTNTKNLRVIDQHIDVPPLLWQIPHKASHLIWLANIQLEWQNLDSIAHLFAYLCRDLLEGIDSPRGQNQSEVLGGCTGKFDGCTLANARGSTGYYYCLPFEAFGHCGGSHGANLVGGVSLESCKRTEELESVSQKGHVYL